MSDRSLSKSTSPASQPSMMMTLMKNGMMMTSAQNASMSLTIVSANDAMVVPNSHQNWTMMATALIVQTMMRKAVAWVTMMSQRPKFS